MSKDKFIENDTSNYDFEDPFVKAVIEEFDFDINNEDDLSELSKNINLSCIIYLLSNIKVKMLKKYWEDKKKRELSDDEVMAMAESKHPFRIYSYTHKMDLDFHWTEKATMYNDINKILTINNLGMPVFTTYNQIELYYALLNKDISFIADYYACLVHVGQRRHLLDMKVDEYVERIISKGNDSKNQDKHMVKK